MGLASNPVEQKPFLAESIGGRIAVTPENVFFISMTMGNGIFPLETSSSCGKLA